MTHFLRRIVKVMAVGMKSQHEGDNIICILISELFAKLSYAKEEIYIQH